MRLFRRSASIGFLLLLAMGVLASASSILPVRAAGAIYINADGSISPSTAPISTIDNVTYVLNGNISSVTDGIVIERTSYIVIDGNGYTLQGSGGGYGISTPPNPYLFEGATVENLTIRNFSTGIYMGGYMPANVTISKNNITGGLSFIYCSADIVENNITGGLSFDYGTVNIVDNNIAGGVGGTGDFSLSKNKINGSISAWAPVHGTGPGGLDMSGNNVTGSVGMYGDNGGGLNGNDIGGGIHIGEEVWSSISGNNISGGISLDWMSTATISGNTIKGGIHAPDPLVTVEISENSITTNHTGTGVSLNGIFQDSRIFENNISENAVGISIENQYPGTYAIYHNNFINNARQVVNATNSRGVTWDDGYPSGGNYWSNYKGTDSRRGPFQNVSGSDGIGDTPYIIDVNNTDHFPLEKPYAGPHDVRITSLVPSKRIVGQGCPVTIDTTVLNYGNSTEVLNVTIYMNGKSIATFSNSAVPSRMSTTLEFSLWNTTGIPYGNYAFRAVVSRVPGERDTSDNTITNGTITITIQGDTNGDKKVNVLDLIPIATHLGILPNSLQWNANLDLNNDRAINVLDLIICATHMGQRW